MSNLLHSRAAALVAFVVALVGAAPAMAQDYGGLVPGGKLDSLRVQYSDSRGRESYPLLHPEGSAPYLALADLARVVSGGLAWDPETYRGSIRFDSLQIAFTLDSSVLWMAGKPVQVNGPVRYADQTLAAPLDLLESVVLPSLGDRVHSDLANGRLQVGGRKPWLESVDIATLGNRVTVTVAPVVDQPYVVSWDPVGAVSISVRGLNLAPGFVTPATKARGISRVQVEATSDGVEIRLNTDAGWTAARSRRARSEKKLEVEISRSPRDVSLPGFRKLGGYPEAAERVRFGQPRRVLLEVAGSELVGGSGATFLENLAQALSVTLQSDFGHEVVRIGDRESSARNEVGPAPTGECWLGLRLETYASEGKPEFLLVVPGSAPRWDEASASETRDSDGAFEERGDEETLGAGAAEERAATGLAGIRAVPWGQVPRVEAPSSVALARSLKDHLAVEMSDRNVRIWPRPARVFRGLAMPAVLIYPTRAGDSAGLSELGDPEALRRLARTIAFGVDEFLLAHGEAP